MIELNHIQKVFSAHEITTAALQDISLHIKEGEFVAVMGPSGCGKSTLLNIIGLLDNPTVGQYHFKGTDVSSMSERRLTDLRRGSIGFVFQSFNLIDDLTVFENVELPLVYAGMKASQRKEQVDELLDRMRISHRATFYPQDLSGGQQQRVAIARAIVTSPGLLLADEPTGNLDSKNGKEVMDTLEELNRQGTTIVMATHNEHDAGYAHRTIHLFDGRIIAEV